MLLFSELVAFNPAILAARERARAHRQCLLSCGYICCQCMSMVPASGCVSSEYQAASVLSNPGRSGLLAACIKMQSERRGVTPEMWSCADAGPIRHSKVQMGSAKLPNPRPRIVFAGSERGRARVDVPFVYLLTPGPAHGDSSAGRRTGPRSAGPGRTREKLGADPVWPRPQEKIIVVKGRNRSDWERESQLSTTPFGSKTAETGWILVNSTTSLGKFFKRTGRKSSSTHLPGKVGLAAATTAAMRINLNIDGRRKEARTRTPGT